MNDKEVVDRLVNGDKSVIDEIYYLYHNKIFQFAVTCLKDEDAALDIIQETFITLWEQRKSLKKNSNIKAFIFTVAKNAVLSVFRKNSTEQKYINYLRSKVITNSSGSTEITNYNFLQEQYQNLLQQLPPKRREILRVCAQLCP